MKKVWHDDAWEADLCWQTQDKRTLNGINKLIKDIDRNRYVGIGKPEPLKEDLSGWWSRRMSQFASIRESAGFRSSVIGVFPSAQHIALNTAAVASE